jgi:LacI family transcriptional regulator
MAGIRDVAKRAGVSTATVNRVLHGGARVSDELRNRVLAAVRELHYVPNSAARALTSGRSRLLGLLVPDIANPFFAELAQGVEDRAADSGYHCLIASSHLSVEREQQFISAFRDRTLAGVALTPSGNTTRHIRDLIDVGKPLIFVDRRPIGLRAPTVHTDNYEATVQAVRYLIELGHQRIAMLAGPPTFETASQRLAGFTDAIKDAGLDLRDDWIRQGHLEQRGGYRAMKEILALPERPTAVFSFNNLLTVGAMQALREHGLRLPHDMSLLSFDDMSLFPYTDPPITAIAQPAYEMGRAAADLLVREVTEPGAGRDIVFSAEFHRRGSCAPPRH